LVGLAVRGFFYPELHNIDLSFAGDFIGEQMREEPNKEQRSRDSDSLRAACGHEGCPVCTVVLEYLDHSIDNWEYEGFSDVAHRYELINSRGFCPLHTWQLAQRSNGFRLGLIYNEILTDVEQKLDLDYRNYIAADDAVRREPMLKRWQRTWFHRGDEASTKESPRYDRCPFCRTRSNIEQRVISTLVQHLRFEEMRQLLSQSTGLCLVHLEQARDQAEEVEPTITGHILACQLTCIRRVQEELRELVRKYDYRFSDEPRGDEMLSWRRGAQLCAGNPGVR
jgi:Family of unknown function (DUF6062)